MRGFLAESGVEEVCLEYFADLGWQVLHGPDIALGELAAERASYRDVLLEGRLRREESWDVLAKDGPPRYRSVSEQLETSVRVSVQRPQRGSRGADLDTSAVGCLSVDVAKAFVDLTRSVVPSEIVMTFLTI